MGRSERADLFERLCDLRAGYGSGPDDRRGAFSIEDVMRDAQAVMATADETAAGAVVTSAADPHPTSPAGTIGLVDFDWTDSERRIRRIDLRRFVLGPAAGQWATSTAGGTWASSSIGSGRWKATGPTDLRLRSADGGPHALSSGRAGRRERP
jgi:hypothetical protein